MPSKKPETRRIVGLTEPEHEYLSSCLFARRHLLEIENPASYFMPALNMIGVRLLRDTGLITHKLAA